MKNDYKNFGYSEACEYIFTLAGDILMCFAPGWVDTLSEYVGYISDILSPAFQNTIDLLVEKIDDAAEICVEMEDLCNAHVVVPGTAEADNGIVISKVEHSRSIRYLDFYRYESYNDTTLKGSEYEKGTWRYLDVDKVYEEFYCG